MYSYLIEFHKYLFFKHGTLKNNIQTNLLVKSLKTYKY